MWQHQQEEIILLISVLAITSLSSTTTEPSLLIINHRFSDQTLWSLTSERIWPHSKNVRSKTVLWLRVETSWLCYFGSPLLLPISSTTKLSDWSDWSYLGPYLSDWGTHWSDLTDTKSPVCISGNSSDMSDMSDIRPFWSDMWWFVSLICPINP